jgi:neutral amino acid transport system permease protein
VTDTATPTVETPDARGAAATPASRRFGLLLVAAALAWLAWDTGFSWAIILAVLVKAGIYAVSAMGLNLHFGYTGLLNFGHVAFMAVGAYTTALLVPHSLGRSGTEAGSWPLVPALIGGMVVAAALGLLLGIPTLRLRGDYLAIATIAVSEILRFGARSFEFTGKTFGVISYSGAFQDLRPGFIDGWADAAGVPPPRMWMLVVAWVTVVIVGLFLRVLLRSPWGRVLRAIREDEDAARALGKNAFWYKLQSLMIGGAIGGLAGGLLAFDLGQLNPNSFVTQETFFVWTIVILGGAATLSGPVAGSIIFWIVLTQTDTLAADLFPGLSTATASGIRFVLVGLLIMALMVFRPQGLFGKREELSLEIG